MVEYLRRLTSPLGSAQGALKEKRWEDAVRHYERLRQQDPEDWRGYGEACVAYRHLNQWDKADAVIEEGLAKLGERRELLIAYGDTAMDRQRWEKALTRWARLREACPNEENGWMRAIEALLQTQYQRAQALLSEHQAALNALVSALMEHGMIAQAEMQQLLQTQGLQIRTSTPLGADETLVLEPFAQRLAQFQGQCAAQ